MTGKCIITNQEWADFADSIDIFNKLIDDPETPILGAQLLYDARSRRLQYGMDTVHACDRANAATPISKEDCPIYTILLKRIQEEAAKLDNDGPDGFF
jgi:hypothetical protein